MERDISTGTRQPRVIAATVVAQMNQDRRVRVLGSYGPQKTSDAIPCSSTPKARLRTKSSNTPKTNAGAVNTAGTYPPKTGPAIKPAASIPTTHASHESNPTSVRVTCP